MQRKSFTPEAVSAIVLSVLMTLTAFGIAYAEPPPTSSQAPDEWWIYLTIVVLFIIFGGVIGFMFILQRQYLQVCDREHQLLIYAKSPAGLPEGTIRAIISFIIIAISLYISVLLFFRIAGDGSKFPDALSSLLGAVVGFYFGSRSGGKGGDGEALKEQISTMAKSRDSTQSDTLLSKVSKGIVMSKAVIDLLPEEQKKKYGDFVDKLEKGCQTVNAIAQGGNVKDAVEKGQALFDLFREENPVRDIFAKSLKSFGSVLGGSVPALAVISTVVGCGVKLVGTAYEKWKKRILNVPITPAVLPLEVVDANTGFTLLLQSPLFKKVFEKKLEANDRPFMAEAADLLTRDAEAFWNKYKGAFDSRAQFDQGLQEFRRAALDRELADETRGDPALFQQSGGLQNFMKSVDRINTDEEAQAALHQLALTVEMLQKKGEPVPSIFEKLKKEEGL